MIAVETDLGQIVVGQQTLEPAGMLREQAQAGALGALGGGDEMDLAGDPGIAVPHRQRVEGFGDDLRRKASHSKQDAAGGRWRRSCLVRVSLLRSDG